MKLIHGFDDPEAYRGGYVAIGNFDGVHRAHQQMVSTLVDLARNDGVPAVVLTFSPHPMQLLNPDKAPPSLSTLKRKTGLLGACGVDCVIAYPTDRTLLNLTPGEFFERIIQRELEARGLVEGPNFCFGRNRSGTVETLQSLCSAGGLHLRIVPAVTIGEQLVSSSAVRELISRGDIMDAVELLGHPYRIQGRVVKGASRGASIGFPTANLDEVKTLLPADGVYAGVVHWAGRKYAAAVNLGPNPTFGDATRKLEVHLLDFTGDLYGKDLEVDFLVRIRDTKTFEDADALRVQLVHDVEQVRACADVV